MPGISADFRNTADGYPRYDGRMRIIMLCAVLLIPAEGTAHAGQDDLPIRQDVAAAVLPPEPVTEASNEPPARIQNMLMHALSLIGVKYRFGGDDAAVSAK